MFLNFITLKAGLLNSQIQSGLTNMTMWKCFDTKERKVILMVIVSYKIRIYSTVHDF